MRRPIGHRRRVEVIWLVVIALVAVSACSRKEGGGDGAPRPSTTEKAGAAAPTITFTVDGVNDNGTKAPDDTTLAQVKKTLDAYLARAVIQPLFSGEPAGDLSDLFTAEARPRLDDAATRATLVEEGLPPASGSITADAVKVQLASVAGPDGVVALVGARLDVKLHAVGPRIDVDIARDGELVLTAQDGSWRIDSFGVRTTRNTRDGEGGS